MPAATIRHATRIRAPPERVWAALATGAGWDGWFTQGAEVEARPGGQVRLRWKEFGGDRVTGEDGGAVLEAVPNRRLAFRWSPQGPGTATTVTFDLEPDGEGTRVVVRDEGYRDGSEEERRILLDCAAGWGEALTLLKGYVEKGLKG